MKHREFQAHDREVRSRHPIRSYRIGLPFRDSWTVPDLERVCPVGEACEAELTRPQEHSSSILKQRIQSSLSQSQCGCSSNETVHVFAESEQFLVDVIMLKISWNRLPQEISTQSE